MEKLSYTLKEASQALGLGMTKVREGVASGAIASFRVGRRILVTRTALDAFIRAQTGVPVADRVEDGRVAG